LAHSRFFPHRNKRFYNCLKKQREGEGEEEQNDVQRGVGVVCWRVVVVVRSKRVVVGVVVKWCNFFRSRKEMPVFFFFFSSARERRDDDRAQRNVDV
jgi:hypothetical protein|tara:strand:- start:152 stop:442 length:291 start_codon:yes stop_codon:yes gene_type:complete